MWLHPLRKHRFSGFFIGEGMTSLQNDDYPLVICYIAIENGHLWLIYLLKIVMFHSYVTVYQRVCIRFDNDCTLVSFAW